MSSRLPTLNEYGIYKGYKVSVDGSTAPENLVTARLDPSFQLYVCRQRGSGELNHLHVIRPYIIHTMM